MSDQTQFHAEHCPECGAPRVHGMTCWEMLGLLIAWEYDDPDRRAEHFLTVASYNLQHPASGTRPIERRSPPCSLSRSCPIDCLLCHCNQPQCHGEKRSAF